MDIFSLFSINKYYKMEDIELEEEAGRWHIGNYAKEIAGKTGINRERIIEQLIEKDSANYARLAILISFVALIVSLLVAILK